MMTQEEFNRWCISQRLTPSALMEIERIRNTLPSRSVGSRCKNVSGRYPSRKMGVTIQFESHKVELPFIYQLEHRSDVLEYYDQPPPFKIQYVSASGRNLGVIITPDFFVISSSGAGWVECKTETELEKLAQKSPHPYQLSIDNKWQSPPGLEYAKQFGFDFQLWSSAKINWILQRNLEFLEDYYKSDLSPRFKEQYNIVTSLVEAHPGISIAELLNYKGVDADSIYSLVATEEIYTDLTSHVLVEAEKCRVFKSRVIENSLNAIICTEKYDKIMASPVIELIPGTSVFYDGVCLNIILVGQDYLLLSAKEFETIEFKISEFSALVKAGKITINPVKNQSLIYEKAIEILKQASTDDLINANRRFCLLKPYLDEQSITGKPKERSLRRWLRNYQQAQEKYGYGYLGLISLNNQKGNRNRKLPQHIIETLEKFITEEYENKKQKTKQAVYASFVNSCSKSGISDDQIPSYKTFIAEIKKRPKHTTVEKRSGTRAAYCIEAFYWELELSTPRHGDFPFHIAHIDHTELDIELRCSKTGKVLGKPWLTLLMDAFTRRILAIYISYDPPSYRSCMMVLRICVQRHSRLPQIIVTDNGKEFYSTYFETLLAMFECTLKRRPPANPRFSSVCERLFGTTNTQFLYNLAGNTQITKKVRLMTKSVNPKNLSVWTLGLLYMHLTEWAYSIYDTTEHPALQGQSPCEAFTTGIKQFGCRSSRLIPNDENFRILNSSIIFIVGPTGVGKTKLRLLIEKWIISSSLSLLEVDKGFIPVASTEARLFSGGLFNFKDHLKRCLYALLEPSELIKHKINYGTSGVYYNLDGQLVIKPAILETELGWALEQALKQRKPKIFFIDEAHHLLAVASGRKLTDIPEAIKSLANITQVLHGLIGTYDLLTLHDVGDQLSRRSIYIHLPRYNAEFTEDREIWQSIIWNFQCQIPTREPPDFLSHWEYLYSRSLGCVGILKNWSRNALAEALNENASTVMLKHLEKRALSVGQCRNILKHIKEGEARYASIEGKIEELYQDLGLRCPPISKQNYSLNSDSKSQVIQPKKRKKSVGIRKPTRDSIGTENAV